MYKISKEEFDGLINRFTFVELKMSIPMVLDDNSVIFYGTEIGKDVLMITVYNCDICTATQLVRDHHIVECNGQYTLRPNYFMDAENDSIFYHPDFVGVMENDNNGDLGNDIQISEINSSDDNILDEQMASYKENTVTPSENNFNASIAARFSPEMKNQMTEMAKAIQKTAKEATDSINYEKISKRMDEVVKETMKPIHDMVNPKVIKEIEPKFEKAKEEMILSQEEKPINPTPVVTTGRRINKPEEKKKSEVKPQKQFNQKPQREVVRATDYVEPKPEPKGYWG